MNVHALPVGFVVHPVSFVHVPINVGKFAKTMRAIVLPVTLVAGTIRPSLFALSISEASDPLTSVGCARRVCIGRSLFAPCIRIVRLIRNGLSQFDYGEVARRFSLRLQNHLELLAGNVTPIQRLQFYNLINVFPENVEAANLSVLAVLTCQVCLLLSQTIVILLLAVGLLKYKGKTVRIFENTLILKAKTAIF